LTGKFSPLLVFHTRSVVVGVEHGFKAMASPTAEFNVVKIGRCSIRFVGEAAALNLCSTPTKASLFFESLTMEENQYW